MTFSDFNLDPAILDGIQSMGYKKPSPIQEQAIPLVIANKDFIACAQTGTGKTAAFVLPLLHKITQHSSKGINTLILVPTRELAIQIDQQIDAMSYFINIESIAIYGGGSGENWVRQKKALTSGVDIVIATPGRLIAHMQMGGFSFSTLKHLVLDEADRMLDMGFSDDILKIVDELPKDRQTLCFSATMPSKIRSLANKILIRPEQINIAISQPASGIRQIAYSANDEQKLHLAVEILRSNNYKSAIVFARSKENVKRLEAQLKRARINAKAFHSDLVQEERETLMQAFKNQRINVLVGTDILSRGIDIEGIDLVLNYDVPQDAENYVHRIGRTARAEKTGTAITFINFKDQRKFASIEKLIKTEIEKCPLPEGYGPAPTYNPTDNPRAAGGAWSGKKKSWNKRK